MESSETCIPKNTVQSIVHAALVFVYASSPNYELHLQPVKKQRDDASTPDIDTTRIQVDLLTQPCHFEGVRLSFSVSKIPNGTKVRSVEIPKEYIRRWKFALEARADPEYPVGLGFARNTLKDRIRNFPRLEELDEGWALYIGMGITFINGGFHCHTTPCPYPCPYPCLAMTEHMNNSMGRFVTCPRRSRSRRTALGTGQRTSTGLADDEYNGKDSAYQRRGGRSYRPKLRTLSRRVVWLLKGREVRLRPRQIVRANRPASVASTHENDGGGGVNIFLPQPAVLLMTAEVKSAENYPPRARYQFL
ncbi:hypothetical protein B0H67DRAFT_219633 [Lasiosphaeris hirsuta]|uniref:Uncharacterized protein n=1 Tax=Lasiosphaeris hirsuta TaxID=260670 RepID=A0AA40DWU7_9PEZI|nr:hypothetical protein B0H67DRAFT_219633 [Lasiosphaeris hirsuta]